MSLNARGIPITVIQNKKRLKYFYRFINEFLICTFLRFFFWVNYLLLFINYIYPRKSFRERIPTDMERDKRKIIIKYK